MNESVTDYSGFDFRALWRGRDRVTAVEREIVRRAFGSADRRRILEVGSGFGRLSATLFELAEEAVASDFDLENLARLAATPGDGAPLRVAANLYHLPFVDGAFTSAGMVRVYHHLSDPAAALAELARVLRSGARLLLSYNPKPSVGTLVLDVRRALRPLASVPFRTTTFSTGTVALDPDPFPIYVASRREFGRTSRAAGFRIRGEVVSGLEEFRVVCRAPTELFVRLGSAFGPAPGFPVRFVMLEKEGAAGVPLPAAEDILACPRCRQPLRFPVAEGPIPCGSCDYTGTRTPGAIDLRYVPPGVQRWGPESG